MEMMDKTSASYSFMMLRQPQLVARCKDTIYEEIKRRSVRASENGETRRHCGKPMVQDVAHGHVVCVVCGICMTLRLEDGYDHNTALTHNRGERHVYTTREHFNQVLLYFTATANRTIDEEAVEFCRVYCGRGPNVTSGHVFDALKAYGRTDLYHYRWEIASRLRGSAEARLSRRETSAMRGMFQRISRVMYAFQDEHDIGSRSRRGKRRCFWPMKFVLRSLLVIIGRSDLTHLVPRMASARRAARYGRYWDLLIERVGISPAIERTPDTPVFLPGVRAAAVTHGTSKNGI